MHYDLDFQAAQLSAQDGRHCLDGAGGFAERNSASGGRGVWVTPDGSRARRASEQRRTARLGNGKGIPGDVSIARHHVVFVPQGHGQGLVLCYGLGLAKGSGVNCAKHPKGRSGN